MKILCPSSDEPSTVPHPLPQRNGQTLTTFIVDNRPDPGKLSFGISAFGASNHLSIERFKMMTETRLVPVSYKAIQQAISGRIDPAAQNHCGKIGIYETNAHVHEE